MLCDVCVWVYEYVVCFFDFVQLRLVVVDVVCVACWVDHVGGDWYFGVFVYFVCCV